MLKQKLPESSPSILKLRKKNVLWKNKDGKVKNKSLEQQKQTTKEKVKSVKSVRFNLNTADHVLPENKEQIKKRGEKVDENPQLSKKKMFKSGLKNKKSKGINFKSDWKKKTPKGKNGVKRNNLKESSEAPKGKSGVKGKNLKESSEVPNGKSGVNRKNLKESSEVPKGKSGVKRKNPEESSEVPPNKKMNLCDMKKKERKIIRKKSSDENYDLNKKIKSIWEELRRENTIPVRKAKLSDEICSLVKGKVIEFVYAHDSVRVLESVLACGTLVHREFLYGELKSHLIALSKSKYGKFVVKAMLRHGSQTQRNEIMKMFHGHVVELVNHTEAAEVVEQAFNEYANVTQRAEIIQEFYGPNYKFFKKPEVHSLNQLLESNPSEKPSVMTNMKETLLHMFEKNVVKHSIVHYVALQFLSHCDADSRSEIIEALHDAVPEILHTKDGSRVAMHCIWHGTTKIRKAVVKKMKPFICKIAKELHGHMVLLAIFDCIDDTRLVEKNVIQELKKELLALAKDMYGRKVLTYLMNPRDSHFFHQDVVNILKNGDNNSISKKDPEIRKLELHSTIAQPLLELVQQNVKSSYRNNAFCWFALAVLRNALGDKQEVFKAVAQVAAERYSSKEVHIIEFAGSHLFLKQLIVDDKIKKEEPHSGALFSEVLINTLPKDSMKPWIGCSRGALLLVCLLETEIPSVVERVKEEMTGLHTELSKKSNKNATLLLNKLK